MMYFAGQYLFSNARQVLKSLSWATGYLMPNSPTASTTLSYSFSKSNSGVCTPTITSPELAYLSCQDLRYGRVRMQLTQV